MKSLVVYAGGKTTEKYANILGEKFNCSKIVNLREETPNINEYDFIIVGSRIRAAHFNRKIKSFLKENKELLLKKKVIYYICCARVKDLEEYFSFNLDEELLDNAISYNAFNNKINEDEIIKNIEHKVSKRK